MDKPLFKLITLKEAEEFITTLPEKVQDKVLYNIRKVRFGVKDINLFKARKYQYLGIPHFFSGYGV